MANYKTYTFLKRAVDILISIVLLAAFWWVLLICALAIKLEEPQVPVTYNRLRVGRNHRLFRMYKFRTMRQDASGTLPARDNLTRSGAMIRALSLDELLQLINVLKGDMSLIGPRPLPPFYLGYFTRREDIRHSVRPGITGLAQIKGRVNLDWDTRFDLDVGYVENISFLNDLRIVGKTLLKVLRHSDILTDGNGVSENFDDYRRSQIQRGIYSKDDILLYIDLEAAKITQVGMDA